MSDRWLTRHREGNSMPTDVGPATTSTAQANRSPGLGLAAIATWIGRPLGG